MEEKSLKDRNNIVIKKIKITDLGEICKPLLGVLNPSHSPEVPKVRTLIVRV